MTKNIGRKADLQMNDCNNQVLGKFLWLLAEEYELDMATLAVLLDVDARSTLYLAKTKGTLPKPSNDRYVRMSHLIGIKKNLEILFPRNPEVRANWLRVPREVFRGKSALEMVASDPLHSMVHLFTVRRLLDMYRNDSVHELT